MSEMIPFGFFTDEHQAIPEHDPGIDGVACPACNKPLTRDDLRTISLMESGEPRSLFYRLHKSCANRLTEAQQGELDERVMRQAGQMGGASA